MQYGETSASVPMAPAAKPMSGNPGTVGKQAINPRENQWIAVFRQGVTIQRHDNSSKTFSTDAPILSHDAQGYSKILLPEYISEGFVMQENVMTSNCGVTVVCTAAWKSCAHAATSTVTSGTLPRRIRISGVSPEGHNRTRILSTGLLPPLAR
ncbi:hypothetical protein LZ023_39220 (plasmid) [Pseudomonas silvicola]|nr:hypothetical protein LZ023_39220 [Pseudomonas silvicola]